MSRASRFSPEVRERAVRRVYERLDGIEVMNPSLAGRVTAAKVAALNDSTFRLPETGNIVICGDAVYCQENYDHDAWGGQADPETAKVSALMLRDRATQENAQMIYGHDRNQVATLRWSTQSYK